jgi:RNA polymerase sigma factor (sigma-70 family)
MKAEMSRKRIADFFKAEYGRMVGYVRRLIDDVAERDAEDVVQDVILNVFDLVDVEILEDISAYVYRSLRNKVIDLMRKRRGTVSLDAPLSDDLSLYDLLSDVRYDASSEVEKREIRQMIFEAIDNLTDEQRAIVIMTELEGRTFRQISERWGVPLGTLLARKSRAMKKLRAALSELS